MPNPARRANISAYIQAGSMLDYTVLSDYPAGLIDWVPPVEDGWTIREHIIHVVDADVNAYTRFGFAISEPGTRVLVWDPDAWKSSLDYAHHSATIGLQLIRLLRSLVAARLNALDDASWEACSIVHPDKGTMTLDDILGLYTGHMKTHLDFVQRNERLWAEADPSQRAVPACN